jgi:hypothetical protein
MATLADLTCDSDGKVDKFINPAVRKVVESTRLRRGWRETGWRERGGEGEKQPQLGGPVSIHSNPTHCNPLESNPTRLNPTPQGGDPLPALPLHELKEKEKYYLAMFMTGGSGVQTPPPAGLFLPLDFCYLKPTCHKPSFR